MKNYQIEIEGGDDLFVEDLWEILGYIRQEIARGHDVQGPTKIVTSENKEVIIRLTRKEKS